jgi:hypothetical protein
MRFTKLRRQVNWIFIALAVVITLGFIVSAVAR